MENITTEEFMDKIDMFQAIFGKVNEFGWWYMEIIQTDANMRFTYKEFQEGLSVHRVQLTLAVTDHQEINVKFEVTWKPLRTTTH